MTTIPSTTHLEPRLSLRVKELAHRTRVTQSKAIRDIIDAHFATRKANALIAIIGMIACLLLGFVSGARVAMDSPEIAQFVSGAPA